MLPADSYSTPFKNWTPWDVVAHLHFFDQVSLLALNDPDEFSRERKSLTAAALEGKSLSDIAREKYAGMNSAKLLENWIEACAKMANDLGTSDPKRRLPWFGPDMGVSMFTTARLMETWAHGQDVYDLMRHNRTYNDRIKHIAVIGVKTFGWTFINRGEEIPGPPPYIRIEAPSGAIWEWNEESDDEFVRGTAVDFCHVVTQGRNVTETDLEVRGPIATYWMSIAQCFAGAPTDPPKAGERTN